MNFFQMPHFIWDMDLDVYERAVLTHIVRKTMGWGKSFDGISLSQFVKDLKISKPKVISTIKLLVEKELIIKKMTKKEDGSQNFNLYQIHPKITKKANEEVVNDIDRGSKPHLQGVVNDIDRGSKPHLQTKETQTKETNTKEINKKNIKKSFSVEVLENYNIQILIKELEIENSKLIELLEYRKELKKPFKTIKGVITLLKNIQATMRTHKKTFDEVYEIMTEREWQSIKPEWVSNLEANRNNQKNVVGSSSIEEIKAKVEEEVEFLEAMQDDKAYYAMLLNKSEGA